MRGNRHKLFLLFIAWIPALIQAQHTPLSSEDMEDLLYRNENIIIPEYHSSILNLNSASPEALEASGIFTTYQLHELLKYREKYGPIYSIHELAILPGFHPSSLLELEAHVSLNTTHNPGNLYRGNNMLMVNLEKSFPVADAYLADTALGGMPKYAGSPLKTTFRIRAVPWNKLSMALTYEKDAGELFLYQNKPQFLSGYFSYEGERFVRQLVVGSFQLNQGVGLVNGTGFFHRVGNFRVTQQSISRIRPYASKTETMYEQGLACKMGSNKIQLLLWASYHRFSLSASAFSENPQTVNWLEYQRTSGFYRNKSELETRELAYRIHSGVQLLYTHQKLSIGLMHGTQWVGPSKKALPKLKQNPGPSPQKKYSLHGNWYRRKLQVFGELSTSEFSSLAFLLGSFYHFNDYLQGSLLIHHFGADYQGSLPSTYSSGSHIQNEQGLAFHLHMETGKYIIAKFSAELFRYPLPRHLTHIPSRGYRLDLSLQNPPNKRLQWRIRVVSKAWQRTLENEVFKIRPLKDYKVNRFDTQLIYKHHDRFRWKSRLVVSNFSQQLNPAPGYAALQQVSFAVSKYLKATAQVVLFHVSEWENRIYLYEPGYYYSFSFPAYYGCGQKTSVLLTIKPAKGVTLSAKISGLINRGIRKWEAGIQLCLKH